MRPRILGTLAGLGLGGLVAMPLLAADGASRTLRLDHGIALDVPEDWSPDDRDEDEDGSSFRWDGSGLRRMHVTCHGERCKDTQEVCTFLLQKEPVEGADDDKRIDGLYASALSRYARLRAVLTHTSDGATIRTPLAKTDLGGRTWWVVETQATPGFKSGFFAETVIGGWYLGAICKTCERGEPRHEDGRAMLSSARKVGEGGS